MRRTSFSFRVSPASFRQPSRVAVAGGTRDGSDAVGEQDWTCRQVAGSLLVTLVLSCGTGLSIDVSAEADRPARIAPWPCRLVVKPTLLGVVEYGWERSPTLQRQCRELAAARAVVILQWGKADSQSRAITRIAVDDAGIVVAHLAVPPVRDAVALVAHELAHIIERTEGLDPAAESKRRGSGVWRAFGGFETQRAIEAGRQASSEVREAERAARIRDVERIAPPDAM